MEGLVLKRINYEETSYILNVLSREGYHSLIVKGAKRKNSMKLSISEPLTIIEFVKSKSIKMPTLIEGSVINSFDNIKNDLVLLSLASVILEYAYVIKDQDVYADRIYELATSSLESIEKDGEIALFRFESLLLKELGSPMKEEFLKENYIYFDELNEELHHMFNDEKINNKEILRRFFSEYYKNELGITIKSKKMYMELIGEIK